MEGATVPFGYNRHTVRECKGIYADAYRYQLINKSTTLITVRMQPTIDEAHIWEGIAMVSLLQGFVRLYMAPSALKRL